MHAYMHTLFYTSNRDQYITITSYALSCKLTDLKKHTNNGPSHLKIWDSRGSECKDYCFLECN